MGTSVGSNGSTSTVKFKVGNPSAPSYSPIIRTVAGVEVLPSNTTLMLTYVSAAVALYDSSSNSTVTAAVGQGGEGRGRGRGRGRGESGRVYSNRKGDGLRARSGEEQIHII